MKWRSGRARLILLAWLVACFAFSAMTDVRMLAGSLAVVAMVFWRQAGRAAKRTLLSAVPLTLLLIALSWAYSRFITDGPIPWLAYAAMALRTTLIAFSTFCVLQTVDLLSALSRWPLAMRLVVITLAQIHALRLLATESLLGLRSRLVRKPRISDAIRGAGGLTATVLVLSQRNARDISDALRSRGF